LRKSLREEGFIMNWKRLLSLVVCMAMMLSLVPAGVLSLSADETTVDTSKLTLFGRTYVTDDVLYLYWTNSGFSFRINGTGATATVTANNQTQIYWGYLNVYVDGEFAPSKTICLNQATQTVTLAEGLPAGEHTIEVRKRNEAGYGGSATIGVKTLTVTGGNFLAPPAAPTRRIEFIGDSITGGFGNLDATGSVNQFTTEMQEGTMTYAVLAAKELGANASIISRSGIGFCITNGRDSIYDYYTKTAVVPSSAVGSTAEWDFNANPSDVVVINLGTNDAGWGLNTAKVTQDAVSLLQLVREKNPNQRYIAMKPNT
jgi:lysophospholipase L1-like esterase